MKTTHVASWGRVNLYPVLVFAFFGLASCTATQQALLIQEPIEEIFSEENFETRLRQQIDMEASNYIGAKYDYGAKGPHKFDCSGLTSYILRKFDIALLGSSMSQARQGVEVHPNFAQPGDILYFKNKKGTVNHIAVVVANTSAGIEVVHATNSRGVVKENVSTSSYWAPRIAGARNVVGCRVELVGTF